MAFVNDVSSALSALSAEVEKLQEKADGIVAPMKEYAEYPRLEDYNWSAFHSSNGFKHGIRLRDEYFFHNSNLNRWWSWDMFTREGFEQGLAHFTKTYEQWMKDCEPLLEQNGAINEHNNLQRNRLIQIMQTIGVRENYSTWEYPTARSKNKKEYKHKAGYLSDLARITPKDNYKDICKSVEAKYQQIKKFGEEKLKMAEAKQAEEQKKLDEEKRQRTFALLQAKYTPDDFDSDLDDVLDSILSKDKYLQLAYFLEKNREDWTDGYHYAECGLHSFIVESETDREIKKEISELINMDDCCDGRVFRDCKWNYNKLYGMVSDQSLIKDLAKIGVLEND